MNRDFVEDYIKLERQHWWFRIRKKIIKAVLSRHLTRNRELQILNIGAAGGASSEWLAGFGRVTSLEHDVHFIDYLRRGGVDVVTGSALDLPFEAETFDLVCAFDVIEHIKNDGLVLHEMKRVCQPEGYVCITVPAFMNLWSQHDVINGHVRRYSKQQLLDLVRKVGDLNVIEYRYFNCILFPAIWMARRFGQSKISREEELMSDFQRYKASGLANRVAAALFGLEAALPHIIKFPFGVSLLAFLQKRETHKEL